MRKNQTCSREKSQENQNIVTGIFPSCESPLLSAGLDKGYHVLGPNLSEIRISLAADRLQQSAGTAEVVLSRADGDTRYALQMLVVNLQPMFYAPGRGKHSRFLCRHYTLATKQLNQPAQA